MKNLSRILLVLFAVCLLAAIWAPGPWWQWALTALVLLLSAAWAGGSSDRTHPTGNLPTSQQAPAAPPVNAERSRRHTYGTKADQ